MAEAASPTLAEVMAAMSIAVDIGMGQPMEQGLGVCRLAVRFGELVGLSGDDLQEVFEVALLRHIGYTAEAAGAACRRRWSASDPQGGLGARLR